MLYIVHRSELDECSITKQHDFVQDTNGPIYGTTQSYTKLK